METRLSHKISEILPRIAEQQESRLNKEKMPYYLYLNRQITIDPILQERKQLIKVFCSFVMANQIWGSQQLNSQLVEVVYGFFRINNLNSNTPIWPDINNDTPSELILTWLLKEIGTTIYALAYQLYEQRRGAIRKLDSAIEIICNDLTELYNDDQHLFAILKQSFLTLCQQQVILPVRQLPNPCKPKPATSDFQSEVLLPIEKIFSAPNLMVTHHLYIPCLVARDEDPSIFLNEVKNFLWKSDELKKKFGAGHFKKIMMTFLANQTLLITCPSHYKEMLIELLSKKFNKLDFAGLAIKLSALLINSTNVFNLNHYYPLAKQLSSPDVLNEFNKYGSITFVPKSHSIKFEFADEFSYQLGFELLKAKLISLNSNVIDLTEDIPDDFLDDILSPCAFSISMKESEKEQEKEKEIEAIYNGLLAEENSNMQHLYNECAPQSSGNDQSAPLTYFFAPYTQDKQALTTSSQPVISFVHDESPAFVSNEDKQEENKDVDAIYQDLLDEFLPHFGKK